MIIITGKSAPSDPEELQRRLGTLRARGVDLLVIGIGDVDTDILQAITSDDSNIESRVWLANSASGMLQYGQDVADFACGEGIIRK